MDDRLLRTIEEYCVGRAETEEGFLVDAFILAKDFEEALQAPFHSPVLLLGRKGTGKTALLKFLELKSKASGIRCLYLKPDDIPLLDGIAEAQATATIKRRAYQALVSAVATNIGARLRGLLGRKDKKLFDKAIVEGARSHDAVQACLHALADFGSIVREINFHELVPSTEDVNTTSLRDSIKTNFQKSNKAFLLLIDDVDQVATITNQKQINRIWGFILAAQKLTEELPNFKTIICLRTEIWAILERDEHGQNDQVDHVRRLIRSLDPTEDEIKKIIHKRLEVVRDHVGLPQSGYLMEQVFEGSSVVLPTTDGATRSWTDFLATSSRGRPRDALQLLSILAEKSRKSHFDKISSKVVDAASVVYSKERVKDLAREYETDCAEVLEIVNSFAGLDFVISTETMREHLKALPSRFSISVRNKQIHPDSDSDTFNLWRFIYEMGLWNPRMPDNRMPRGFRHLNYDQQSSFVSKANWNQMQKVEWELHPAYRSHFDKLREDDKARWGISLKTFRKK